MMLVGPVPAFGHKSLAADLLAAASLGPQFFLHLQLGGDAGVVGAGHPQRGPALHAIVANHQVFQGDGEGVALVQHAGHVGRGNADDKGLAIGIAGVFRLEPAVLLPPLVETLFRRAEIVSFGKCEFGHGDNLVSE